MIIYTVLLYYSYNISVTEKSVTLNKVLLSDFGESYCFFWKPGKIAVDGQVIPRLKFEYFIAPDKI